MSFLTAKLRLSRLLKKTLSLIEILDSNLNHVKQFREEMINLLSLKDFDNPAKEAYNEVSEQIRDQTLAREESLGKDYLSDTSNPQAIKLLHNDIYNSDEKWWYTGSFINLCLAHQFKKFKNLDKKTNLYPVTSFLEFNHLEIERKNLADNLRNHRKRFDIIPVNNTSSENSIGSHWAVMFIDHTSKEVSYIDSKYASNLNINDLMLRLENQERKILELFENYDDSQDKIGKIQSNIDKLTPIKRAYEAFKKLGLNYKFNHSSVAIQDNDYDCGPHIVERIISLFRTIEQDQDCNTIEANKVDRDKMINTRIEHFKIIEEFYTEFNNHINQLIEASSDKKPSFFMNILNFIFYPIQALVKMCKSSKPNIKAQINPITESQDEDILKIQNNNTRSINPAIEEEMELTEVSTWRRTVTSKAQSNNIGL